MLGGVDVTGPHLYSIHPHGSTDKLPYVTMGECCSLGPGEWLRCCLEWLVHCSVSSQIWAGIKLTCQEAGIWNVAVRVPPLKAQELGDSQNLAERKKKIPPKLDLQVCRNLCFVQVSLGGLTFCLEDLDYFKRKLVFGRAMEGKFT